MNTLHLSEKLKISNQNRDPIGKAWLPYYHIFLESMYHVLKGVGSKCIMGEREYPGPEQIIAV